MGSEDWTAATAPLTEAFTVAFREGDHSLAVEAWARRAWTRGTSGGGPESLAGLDVVEAAAGRLRLPLCALTFLQQRRFRRDRPGAPRPSTGGIERALREARGVVGPGAAELLNVRVNLGFTTDDPEQRDQILEEAEAEAKALGPDHPRTLDTRWLRGRRVLRLIAPPRYWHPHARDSKFDDEVRGIRCWSEEAYLRNELGDAGAVAAMQRASSLRVAGDAEFPIVLPYLHLWQGNGVAASKSSPPRLRRALRLRMNPVGWLPSGPTSNSGSRARIAP